MKKIGGVVLLIVFISLSLFYFHQQAKSMYVINAYNDTYGDKMITVATYNIRFGQGQDGKLDLERTIQTLQTIDADIISLQEVERYSIRSGFQDQVKQLADELKMNAAFYPSLSYPGLYYGNVILSKYPIKETLVLPFRNTMEDRAALFALVEISETDAIYVGNTHLGLNQEERGHAILEIYETIQLLDGPVLLKGDLNTTPDQEEYLIWNSLLTKSNIDTPLQTFAKRNWQIDYIFHSSDFSSINTVVHQSEASDHYPVISQLVLQRN